MNKSKGQTKQKANVYRQRQIVKMAKQTKLTSKRTNGSIGYNYTERMDRFKSSKETWKKDKKDRIKKTATSTPSSSLQLLLSSSIWSTPGASPHHHRPAQPASGRAHGDRASGGRRPCPPPCPWRPGVRPTTSRPRGSPTARAPWAHSAARSPPPWSGR